MNVEMSGGFLAGNILVFHPYYKKIIKNQKLFDLENLKKFLSVSVLSLL